MSLGIEHAIWAVGLGEAPRPVGRLACRARAGRAERKRRGALGAAGLGAARLVMAPRRCDGRRRGGSKSESIFEAF